MKNPAWLLAGATIAVAPLLPDRHGDFSPWHHDHTPEETRDAYVPTPTYVISTSTANIASTDGRAWFRMSYKGSTEVTYLTFGQ